MHSYWEHYKQWEGFISEGRFINVGNMVNLLSHLKIFTENKDMQIPISSIATLKAQPKVGLYYSNQDVKLKKKPLIHTTR